MYVIHTSLTLGCVSYGVINKSYRRQHTKSSVSYLATSPAFFVEKMSVKFLLKEITCPGLVVKFRTFGSKNCVVNY